MSDADRLDIKQADIEERSKVLADTYCRGYSDGIAQCVRVLREFDEVYAAELLEAEMKK